MAKVQKADWLQTGLTILVEEGFGALTIDRLCRTLDVTKGSFYHHFASQPQFIDALLTHWEEFNTLQIVAMAKKTTATDLTIPGLLAVLAQQSAERANPEIGLRAWANQNQAVRTFLEKMDAQRIDMLLQALQPVFPEPGQAERTARLLYAMLVGCYSLHPPVIGPQLEQLFARFQELLMPATGTDS